MLPEHDSIWSNFLNSMYDKIQDQVLEDEVLINYNKESLRFRDIKKLCMGTLGDRNWFNKSICCKLENGKQNAFQKHYWEGQDNLQVLLPNLHVIVAYLNNRIVDMGAWTGQIWNWKVRLMHEEFNEEEAIKLCELKEFCIRYSLGPICTCCSSVEDEILRGLNMIWKSKVPKRSKFLVGDQYNKDYPHAWSY